MLKVRQVANQLGVNPQTIYFYERIGLIPAPARNSSGYRLFNDQDIARLTLIGRAKSLGMTLEEIKEVLTLQDDDSLTCEDVQSRLLAKVQHIEDTIAELTVLKEELLALASRCNPPHHHTDPDCGVFSES